MTSHDTTRPTAVIAALKREIAPLLRQVQVEARIKTEVGRFLRARFDGRSCVLGWTGDGSQSAQAGLRSLLENQTVGRLVLLGVAGGLSPGLEAESLLLADEVQDSQGTAPPPDLGWAGDAGPVPTGLLYSSESIVSRADDKVQLWRQLGEPAAAAIDLETATWARMAAMYGLPYLAIRAISDSAQEDLPLDFERYRDRRGRVRQLGVAGRAIVQPSLIGPLRRLERRVNRCADRLTAWVAGCGIL